MGPEQITLLGHDNRISLWDVELNKQRRVYIEKKHLSHTYVSCAWRHGNKDDLGTLAVGCSDGIVLIWDLVRGVVSTVIGNSDEIHMGRYQMSPLAVMVSLFAQAAKSRVL